MEYRSHRQRSQMAVLGPNPPKRRGTPIPVQPPRIPTPMPAVNNNNPQTRVVLGGNAKTKEQLLRSRADTQDVPVINNATRKCPKYLDNEIQWINPRLMSKIDLELVTSTNYDTPPSLLKHPNANTHLHQRCSPPGQPATAVASYQNQYNYNVQQRGGTPSWFVNGPNHHHQQQQQQSSVAVTYPPPPDHHHHPPSQYHHHQQQQQQNAAHSPHADPTLAVSTARCADRSSHKQLASQQPTIASSASMCHRASNGNVMATSAATNKYKMPNNSPQKLVMKKPAKGGDTKISKKVSVVNETSKVVSSSLKLSASCNGVVASSGRQQAYHVVPYTRHETVATAVGVLGVAQTPVPMPSGVYGMYTETKYTFAVNGMPGSSSQASAAAAFFARASQKLNLTSSPHRRKRQSSVGEDDVLVSGYSGVIQRSPPPVPPALLRRIGVREVTGVGKVKVMLRVSSPPTTSHAESSGSFFSLDKRKKQVTLFDPSVCNNISSSSSAPNQLPEDRRVGVAAPKMFAFDAIFSQDDSQTEVCSSALTDVIHAVINGTDGCLFCFGHAGLGKSYTMLGSPDNANTLGIIPCAITWLFRGINEQKQKTGARFSVRVSAVEVCGPSNQLKDLLAGHANESEQSPGVYLRDDPVFGTQLQNHSELRVPTAEKAAFYLDAALDSRGPTSREHPRDSHLLYTLHVYQYSVAGKGGVAGGRSRLHLIDLGNSDRGKSSGGIPLSGLGNILLAIFNGQKHLPYKEHKLTHVLKECLSSITCHAAMIVHVSPCTQNYVDTLTTVQLASRIHRMRRRKFRFVPAGTAVGSGGSSGEEATRTTGTSSEPDPSSSDLSADTVIYVGPTADDATDGEHPPVYIPSLNSGDNRCAMGKVLRGSSAEHKPEKSPIHKANSLSKQSSPVHKMSPAHANSAKSSPIRLKSNSQSSSKIPVFNTTPINTSDEQWIDGPRISKHKVAEARHLMKEAGHIKKRETWIDGPMQANPSTTAANAATANANGSYGYMDTHKKNMIRKWVENQTSQIQKTKHPTTNGDYKATTAHSTKELTTFKICEDDDENMIREVNPLLEDSYKKQEVEKSVIRTGLKMSKDKMNENAIPECRSSEEMSTPASESNPKFSPCRERDFNEIEDDEELVVEIPPALPLIQPLSSREVSMESLDVRIKERLMSNNDMDDQTSHYQDDLMNDEDDEILEIIEVEEPLEPVPMQDCCLQVTEEDIALCMGKLENPLPEDEQGNPEEHPLRILSQENLTVVSTFTDSMSVFTDLERAFPRNRYDPATYLYPETRTYSICSDDYEDPDCIAPDLLRNVNPENTSRRKFEQLARLHELYTNRLAKANVTNSVTYKENKQEQKIMTRCESLSLSEMLYGNTHETGSIYSEPPYRPDQDTFCQNCKVNMSRPATALNWYNDPQLSASATNLAASDNLANIGGRFQRFCHKSIRDSYNIASLRHPDGASNPNLKEEVERVPGNGASNSDHDEELRFKKEKIEEFPVKNNGILQPLPLPLHIPSDEQINRRKLSIGTGLMNIKSTQQSEGYDSGHDSTPRTSKHSPAAISRRAESGYDSVVRDSESSSIDSDISRKSHALQTRGGKYKNKHGSFCSWLLNPFTCKHVDEPPETHF